MIKKIIESEHSKEVHVDGLKEKTIEDMAYGNRDVHRDVPFDPNDMDLILNKWER